MQHFWVFQFFYCRGFSPSLVWIRSAILVTFHVETLSRSCIWIHKATTDSYIFHINRATEDLEFVRLQLADCAEILTKLVKNTIGLEWKEQNFYINCLACDFPVIRSQNVLCVKRSVIPVSPYLKDYSQPALFLPRGCFQVTTSLCVIIRLHRNDVCVMCPTLYTEGDVWMSQQLWCV